MKSTWVILKKEVKTTFTSPIAYVIISAFLVLSGSFFTINLINFSDDSVRYPE